MDSQKSIKTYYGFLLVKKVGGTICGRFPVTKKECTLGRDNNCDIRILLEKVSAQQCIILCVDNKAYVRDKSVAGSTKVNGKKVGRSNFLLRNSDEIDICGRKFIWEYPKKPHGELNNLSGRKSGIQTDHLSPRAPERFSNQVTTPLDNNRIFSTSAKSSMKTPSKTIISLNKTPIIVTTENMSKSSFDEVQNSFLNQNSATTALSKPKLMKSYSMTPVRNIPLLGDSKITQRKSWIVTNTSDNSSSIGTHNRLSTERLKRDSTPVLNSSYHYEDEDVEFDSPDPPSIALNSEHSVDINASDFVENNCPVDNQSKLNDEDDDILQSNKDEINKITAFESEQSASRRDTYSVDDTPIVFEQNTTPAPRRSILKCSKTTKPKSRSSCRMVQFARLPKTDSKIKNTKTRLNPGFNFIVTDDENNVIDFNQSTKSSTQFDVEEYDDDLDGVQPLDSSVSSLINSPILDSSIVKSSKRGSRGNKVMSLVNSIEKRTNESSKHSIRASDLLSINGSKNIETSPTLDHQNDTNILQESASSTRRINLEDIFEAEDSLKTSCNVENETLDQDIKESPVKSVDRVSSPKTNLFNITDSGKIADNVFSEDSSENDPEYEYTFVSPLNNLPTVCSSSIKMVDNNSTFVDTEKDFSSTEIIHINSKLDISSQITEDCTSSTNESPTKSDDDESLALDHELSTSPHDGNIDETHKDNSNNVEKTVDEEMCDDDVETPNNITELSEKNKSIEKECNQKQNDDSIFVNDDICINEVQTSKNDVEFTNKMKPLEGDQNDVELTNKSTDLDLIEKQNYVSKVVEQTLNGETPSIVVQSMSEMFNTSIDEHETTHSQHKESLVDTYILMEKDDLHNSLEVNELKKVSCNKTLSENSVLSAETVNKSLLEAIEIQLDKIHCENDTSSNCDKNSTVLVNSTLDLNKQKTLTSNLVLEETDTENLTLKINDNSLNTLNISKPESPAKDNVSNICLTAGDISNVSELPTISAIDETNTMQNIIIVNNEDSNSLSKTILSDNISPKPIKKNKINLDQLRIALGTNTSKELKKSVQSPTNKSFSRGLSKIDSSRRIAELCLSSSSDDNENDTTNKNLEHSLDTSIGKPRYESTPWNWSKSSKTPYDSTTSIQPNETTRDKSAENENIQRDQSRSRSVTPFATQKEWSQMMKEFNESVKKASVNININISNTSIHKKKLFVKKSKLSQVSVRIPAKDSNIKNNTPEIKKNNSVLQSMMSHNTSKRSMRNESVVARRSKRNESPHVRRSKRNESPHVRRSNRSNKLETSCTDNYNSSDKTSNSGKILPRKKKSIDNKTIVKTNKKTVKAKTNRPTKIKAVPDSKSEDNSTTSSSSTEDTKNKRNSLKSSLPSTSVSKNESNYFVKENDKVTKDYSFNSKVYCYLSSPNEIKTFDRELRGRKLNNSSIKTKKNTLNADKGKPTEKSKKNNSSTKRYNSNTNNALSESGILKTLCVVKSKSTKISKTVKTKKSTNLRSNKNARSKRLLPSKPIKTSTNDSSEYESSSEPEEKIQKLQSVDPPKSIKEKTQKKDVNVDNNVFLLPTRRSQRGKSTISDVSLPSRTRKRVVNTSLTVESTPKPKATKEKTKKKDVNVDNNVSSLSTKRNLREKSKTSDVTLQPPKTQSRKRAADTSPLSQPKTKGKKCDISSKIANTVSRISDSPNIRTRNKSKLSVKQVSDNSSSESIIVSKNEKKKSTEKVKPKSNEKTRATKRQLNSDNCSFDSAPSTSKKIRQVTFRGAESENKKSHSSTSSTSKTKIQNTDNSTEPNTSLKVKYNKNAEKSTLPIQRKTRNAEKSISPVQRKTRNAEKSISPVQRKTRNAEKSISPVQRKTRNTKQAAPKDKDTFISPRVLRVRDKKK